MLLHHIKIKDCVDVDVVIVISICNKLLEIAICHDMEITEVVFYVILNGL